MQSSKKYMYYVQKKEIIKKVVMSNDQGLF